MTVMYGLHFSTSCGILSELHNFPISVEVWKIRQNDLEHRHLVHVSGQAIK